MHFNACKSERTEDIQQSFPYTKSELIQYNLVGPALDYLFLFPEKSDSLELMICEALNNCQDFELSTNFIEIDSSVYFLYSLDTFLEGGTRNRIRVCYSGTFYFETNNLDSVVQYSSEFTYSIDSLENLIHKLTEENNISLKELLMFSQYEATNFWIPHLLFFINIDSCNLATLQKVREAQLIIYNTIDRLKQGVLDSNIVLAPRIFITKRSQ